MTPSQEWVEDCMEWWGRVLTGEKAHWCFDWDDLPIDETCEEYEFCNCCEGTINDSRDDHHARD